MAETLLETRRKSMLFLATGLVIAGATAFIAWRVLTNYQTELAEARRPVGKVEVVVASRDLMPGQTVEETDLDTVQFTASEVPGARIYSTKEEVVGQVLEERVLAGEPIRKERFIGVDTVGELASMVPEGARAVTVKVDREGGLGGLLKTGVYVDLIVTIRPDENSLGAAWVTETILQSVRVLSVGTPLQMEAADTQVEKETKRINPPRELYVTLEVEPDEAETLAMASARGILHMSLRTDGDLALLPPSKPLVTNAMVGLTAIPSPARVERLAKRRAQLQNPPAAPGSSAEVIEGSKVRQEHFDAQGKKLPIAGQR